MDGEVLDGAVFPAGSAPPGAPSAFPPSGAPIPMRYQYGCILLRVMMPRARELPPSDAGLEGAIPLSPDSWHPEPISDEAWAEQNRKANDLLMGRACD